MNGLYVRMTFAGDFVGFQSDGSQLVGDAANGADGVSRLMALVDVRPPFWPVEAIGTAAGKIVGRESKLPVVEAKVHVEKVNI